MLMPRFSLGFIFALTAAAAVVFLVMSWAMQGTGWAVGVTMALVMLAVIAVVHAAFFALVWLFSLVGRSRRKVSDAS
jgi:hypothetical protein